MPRPTFLFRARSALRRSLRSFFLQVLAVAIWPVAGFALEPAENLRNYIFTHWDAEDGLPQNFARHILQTRDGYLWIGTMQGLSRFDGLTFTNFKSPGTAGFPSDVITGLAETADGSLWVASSVGLGRYRDGRFTTYLEKDGLKTDTVNALCVAPDGSLWIGSRAGITRWIDERFVKDIDTSGFETIGMQGITVDRQKTIWVATGIEALRYSDGKFTRYGKAQGLPENTIRSIREDAAGNLLAVTQQGLWRLAGEVFVPFQPRPSNPRINATLVDRDGNFWIGSAGGLERLANGALETYLNPQGETPGAIDVIFEDREGSLWIGGASGLSRLNDRRGRTLSVEEGVLGTSGLAVRQSRDGSIWMSSWAGGVVRFQNGIAMQYKLRAPLSHESVTCIYEGPDGTMWFGNRGSSVDRLEGDKVTTYVLPSGVATSRYVSAMHMAPNGELLLGIAGRGLLALRDEGLVAVPEAAALTSGIIWAIHRTRDNRLLIGTTVGLYERLASGAIQPIALPGIAGKLSIRDLLEETDGSIWFATAGHGLVRWKSGAVRVYGEREGMIGDSVSGVLDDGMGSLWVSSSRGIARILRREFADMDAGTSGRLNITIFGRADGLVNASVSSGGAPLAARLNDGRLVFATDKGFATLDSKSLQLNHRPPTVVVESIVADDRVIAVEPGKPISVPAGTSRLEIRYTALSLIAPHLLRFRYQLEGSDGAWVEAGRERRARYTHPAPGDYRFRVLACNSDGVWNETGAELRVVVQPFFYQTRWFIGLTALSLTAAAVGLVRTRARLSRQRMAALEKLVNERTRELRLAKESAEDAREESARERSRFKFIFESLPVGVTWMGGDRPDTRLANLEHARITGTDPAQTANVEADWKVTHPDDRAPQAKLQEELAAGRIERYSLEKRYVRPDGSVVWAALTVRSFHDPSLGETQQISTLVDITGRMEAEASLRQMHQQLVETSRHAGMAEVATSVLHNVGNVLNSVNVSATVVADRVRRTKAVNIGKIAALLEEHKATLGAFLAADSRGQMIPAYLGTLAASVNEEQKVMLQELEHLRKNIEHIKDIVSMQQANARFSGVVETVPVSDMIEDAIRINAGSLDRHDVAVSRDFQAPIAISTDKHKVMQILINLIRNAKQACDEARATAKRVLVRTRCAGQSLEISIVDNGIGIPAENLRRIFNHGFTTRKNGHGFGLHSASLAAKELGGELRVTSDGPGTGATFILELPLDRAPEQSAAAGSTAPQPACASV